MILGLDVSTSCTGWCVLGEDGSLVKMGFIGLSKDKNIFKKAQKVRQKLSEINIEYGIERVFVEENLQAFRPGLSSAKTLLTLARFNGIVSYISQLEFYSPPEFINVNSARKNLSIKIKRSKDCGKTTKDQVLEWVTGEIGSGYLWPTKTMKSGKRKGQTVLETGCFDMADAYVIARAGLIS
jgi:Holliday junction resolvasome RuvABC endonuclease subunit